MTDRCCETITMGGKDYPCDRDAGHTGLCGFSFGGRSSAHWMNRALSDDELRKLSEGILDPKDVK